MVETASASRQSRNKDGYEDAYKGEAVFKEVLDTVVKEVGEVLDVVGEAGDDPAGLLLGVELQGQRLQVPEESVPEVQDHVLADPTHPEGLHVPEYPGPDVDEHVQTGCQIDNAPGSPA